MDTVTPEQRSENMRRIRSKDTRAEMLVRQLVHSLGYRYILHLPKLPGKPDLVFSKRKKVIFIHGCFWHQHKDPNCKITRIPKSNNDYWLPKLENNVYRDQINRESLKQLGWEVLVVWECTVTNKDALTAKIKNFLGPTKV